MRQGTTRRALRPFVSMLLLAIAVPMLALDAPRADAATKTVSVSVTGGLTYASSGPLSAGSMNVSKVGFGALAVHGSAQFPGKAGGLATLAVNIDPLLGFPLYFGSVSVSDPNAKFSVQAQHFFGPVNPLGSNGVKGSSTWFRLDGLDFKVFTVNWSVAEGSPEPVNYLPVAKMACYDAATPLPPNGSCQLLYGAPPRTVVFDGRDSTPSAGAASIVEYLWNFGDGLTATGSTLNHTYNLGGVYKVSLTVKDSAGKLATVSNDITVQAPPAPIVPPNFRFTDSGYQHLDMAWSTVADADLGYDVEVHAVRGCISFGTQSFHYAQAVGSARVSAWDICLGSVYEARIRSLKTGTPDSGWSDWAQITA